VAALADRTVGKLILLGTPNLGTLRGHLEARAELAGRPLRLIGADILLGPTEDDGRVFLGGAEQTVEFLLDFNERINDTNAAEVHLIAGTGGLVVLDPVLECSSHDDRVCEESALGGFPGALTYRVAEKHEDLGRGPESLPLVSAILFGTPAGGVARVEAIAAGGGGGQGGDPSFPPSDIYTGILEPGGVGALPLTSDTSESIIILLSSELPGGIEFNVATPLGVLVDPPAAGALQGVDYQTYGDGEGHEVQAYEFQPGEIGSYTAHLSNPAENVPIQYTLESYVESDLVLEISVNLDEIDLGETTGILATLSKNGVPETDATVDARVWRPDGELEVVVLLDDGSGIDALADDGVYSASVTSGSQPGIHEVEGSAIGTAGNFTLYRREATTRFQVLSDAAVFTGGFSSGTADAGGVFSGLWVETSLDALKPGIFFVSGELTDLAGTPVASAGTLMSVLSPQTTTFQLTFSGSEIFEAHTDGPYVLSEIVLLDGSAGFVVADHLEGAHTTAAYSWSEFGVPTQAFVRGDANGDAAPDISDAIVVLEYLFTGSQSLFCLDAGDANGDGDLSISDPIYLLSYLFQGGGEIPPPYPGCGMDEILGCDAYAACN
jgi:hypothetical protein